MSGCDWPISFDENGDDIECGKPGRHSYHQGGRTLCPHHFKLQEESVAQMLKQTFENIELNKASIPAARLEYTETQPPPKNEIGAVPIWPAIIREIEKEIDEFSARVGLYGNEQRMRNLDLLASNMRQRHAFGIAKYGVPLVAKNDRDHLVDALQEALDGVVYLRAEIEKRGGYSLTPSKNGSNVALIRIYQKQLEIAIELRGLIYERDGR